MAGSGADHYHEAKHLGHERRRRRLKRETRASLMSDAKWRKFFAVVGACPSIRRLKIKFFDSETVHEIGVPSLSAPWAWAEFSLGPEPFREIEWVEVPRSFALKVGVAADQDIGGLTRALADLGRFPITEAEDGLRLIGHLVEVG